jgi:hypothetical protein
MKSNSHRVFLVETVSTDSAWKQVENAPVLLPARSRQRLDCENAQARPAGAKDFDD